MILTNSANHKFSNSTPGSHGQGAELVLNPIFLSPVARELKVNLSGMMDARFQLGDPQKQWIRHQSRSVCISIRVYILIDFVVEMFTLTFIVIICRTIMLDARIDINLLERTNVQKWGTFIIIKLHRACRV